MLKNSRHQAVLTRTVRRQAAWTTALVLGLFITFNYFTLALLDRQLESHLDRHLSHEIDHFLHTFYLDGDSLVIVSPLELQEPDLNKIGDSAFFLQIYSAEGHLYLRSANLETGYSIPMQFPDLSNPEQQLQTVQAGGQMLRTGYRGLADAEGKLVGYLQLSTPKASALAIADHILWFNLLSFPLVVLLVVAMSILMARRSYQPINKIINLAQTISVRNLKDRIRYAAPADDELGRLRDTLNDLFDRLENQFDQISRFTDNASHQLMSPLTILSSELAFLETLAQTPEEQATIRVLQEQTQRMIHVVKVLLILAKGSNSKGDDQAVFELQKLVQVDVLPHFAGHRMAVDIPAGFYLKGHGAHFALALQNIIENAIKYSPAGSPVSISARSNAATIEITVADQGFGVPDDEKSKLFDRFYRGRRAQAEGIHGYGLGLALASTIVETMSGRISLRDNAPAGSIFTVSLPQVVAF